MLDLQGVEESAAELLAGAEEEGFRVSRTQLHQWQQAGYLPRPRLRGLGRGKGSETLYPAGSKAQLLVICEALKKKRRLVEATWALWWRGYPVAEKRVRKLCEWEIARLEARIYAAGFDADYADGDASNPVEIIDAWARHARLPKPLSAIRKLLGVERFASFVVFFIKAAAGAQPRFSHREEDLDVKIVTKGFGLANSQETKAALEEAEWLLDLRKYREALAGASLEELCAARDEVRKAAHLFMAFAAMIAADRGFALDPELVAMLTDPDSAIGTNLILVWLWMRKLPEAPQLYEEVIGVARDVANGTISAEEALERLPTLNSEDSHHV